MKNIESNAAIEVEEENVPWAAAGSNSTLALVSVDPIQLMIGSVLCPPTDPVPFVSTFTARIIIFDIQIPIISGAMVNLTRTKQHCVSESLLGGDISSFA
jgi:elongation factor 1 alpha-like protein